MSVEAVILREGLRVLDYRAFLSRFVGLLIFACHNLVEIGLQVQSLAIVEFEVIILVTLRCSIVS